MVQEVLNFANEALRIFDEMENHIFANHRARYATAKSVLDNYREEIDEIIRALNENPDDETASALQKDITAISESVKDAHDTGVIEPVKEMETLDSTINSMISDLDNSNAPETVLPTANIDIQAIENAMPVENVAPEVAQVVEPQNMEVDTTISNEEVVQNMVVNPEVMEVPTFEQPMMNTEENVASEIPLVDQGIPVEQPQTYEQVVPTDAIIYENPQVQAPEIMVAEGSQDVIPEVQQIVIEEAPMNEVVVEQAPEIQIMEGTTQEVVENVTPDIQIIADQPDQVMPTEEITIPNGEAMIQVPNMEMNTQMVEQYTTQEAQA